MILESLLILLAVLTFAILKSRDLIHAVIFLGGADAVLALVFYLMAAPDVAIMQAIVGAGLTTFIFMLAIKKTREEE
jgi:uncharacterized MnhB-related membrane protein